MFKQKGKVMSRVIYTDEQRYEYYESDIREDERGDLYLYDEAARQNIYLEDDKGRDRDARRGRGRDDGRGRGRDGGRDRGRRKGRYKIEDKEDLAPAPMSRSKAGVKNKATYKVETDFSSIDAISNYNSKGKITNDLFNGLKYISKNSDGNTYYQLEYPLADSMDVKVIEDLIKFINDLVLTTDCKYTGRPLTDEEDKITSRIINLSFSGIKMIDVASNLTLLMSRVGQSDIGWKEAKERLELLGKGKMMTNVYTIADEDMKTAVKSVLTGTSITTLDSTLKDKLNILYAGFVIIDDIVLSINYSVIRMFMIL